jgi:twitching motility two-component system response regulator PilH
VHVLKGVLEKGGHNVSSADNAEDGIKQAKAVKPDVILMDVVMPGMNGFQATRALTKDPETQHIPIIIVTTKDQETDRVWGLRQGAKDYVTKPVDANDLLAKVKAVL